MRFVRTAIVVGLLVPPLSAIAKPQLPESIQVNIARAALESQSFGRDLKLARVLPLRQGTLVRFEETYAGLDVVGATAVVRLDDKARVRWTRSSVVPISGLDTRPALTAEAAIASVQTKMARGKVTVSAKDHSRLVVYMRPGVAPRLAWLVVLPRNLALMETLSAYVDAKTGKILKVANLVRRDRQASVYEFNPSVSEEAVITLESLAVGASSLLDDDIEAFNCIDNKTCTAIDVGLGPIWVHSCEPQHTAYADGSGDFLAYVHPESDLESEDPFSEIQMYYHAAKAYAAFRIWANDDSFGLDAQPLKAMVNVRIPDYNDLASAICSGEEYPDAGELIPFDNAAYMPEGTLGGLPPEDMMVFGQGTLRDFAYDGDIVYHEFTHAVMGSISSLGDAVPDAYGLDNSPAAMHEAFADYFSSAITGDPEVGEYAGGGMGGDAESGAIRSLENDKTCPEDLWGESHQDSEPWSAALWAIRTQLTPEEQPIMDAAMFTVISSLSAWDNFATATELVLEELEVVLGESVCDLALAELTARGLGDCNSRIIVHGADEAKDMLVLYGTDLSSLGVVPGPVQFRIELAEAATEITVTILSSASLAELSALLGGGDPEVKLLVKAGEEPILWDWTGDDPVSDAPVAAEVALVEDEGGEGTATGSFPAGTYHVMFTNSGGTVFLGGISFSSAYVEAPDAGTVDAFAGEGADTAENGCSCKVGGKFPRSPLLLALAMLAIVFLRRR